MDCEGQVSKVWSVKRLTDDKRWDGDAVMRGRETPLKGADIKVSTGSFPPVPPPPSRSESILDFAVKPEDISRFGFTPGCKGCRVMWSGARAQPHDAKCRRRIMDDDGGGAEPDQLGPGEAGGEEGQTDCRHWNYGTRPARKQRTYGTSQQGSSASTGTPLGLSTSTSSSSSTPRATSANCNSLASAGPLTSASPGMSEVTAKEMDDDRTREPKANTARKGGHEMDHEDTNPRQADDGLSWRSQRRRGRKAGQVEREAR